MGAGDELDYSCRHSSRRMLIKLFSSVFRLSEVGKQVGLKVVDLIILREKNYKREIKLLHILLFIRSVVWKVKKGFVHENDNLACYGRAYLITN